jgi:hypothetical protein
MPTNWEIETPIIISAAKCHNIDWAFVAAIRAQENGGEGKQYGVLDGNGLTYNEQLSECCATVAHRLESYPANPLVRCYGANGISRIRYTPSFISYFASIWCPIGAGNDPTGLNKNWYPNVLKFYQQFVAKDLA